MQVPINQCTTHKRKAAPYTFQKQRIALGNEPYWEHPQSIHSCITSTITGGLVLARYTRSGEPS